uniref:Fibrinogen C-terminal domain-containing protein n=1 Tax=Macrostomum lignano TaxID=282301 RepID=A0A1I8GKX9_9PLAT
MQLFQLRVSAALALLLCSLAAGQVSQCAPADSPRLRFVAQLSVNGCALFVHDTGASDGPHLAVEPLMCVTDSLRGIVPRFDFITQQLYFSVPVLMKDSGMLAEAQRQLQHLSPRSVSFATVTNISVSADTRSSVRVLGFLWTPDESVATLRLGFAEKNTYETLKLRENIILRLLNIDPMRTLLIQSTETQIVEKKNESSIIETLKNLLFCRIVVSMTFRAASCCKTTASSKSACTGKNSYPHADSCGSVGTSNSRTALPKCTRDLDIKGHFLIEPLLCHNISSLSSESVRYDYSRDMHYLKLDLVLQDEATRDAVRTQLADLSPRSVDFMRLWTAERSVSSSLSARFEVGPLMASADWRSAQLRLLCGNWTECRDLRTAVLAEPADLWRHVQWRVTSLVAKQCLSKSSQMASSWRMKPPVSDSCYSLKSCARLQCASAQRTANSSSAVQLQPDGRCFLKFQQRLTGRVSFQRNWTEYETGFGDGTDFWIGLSAIHSLSQGGATLRVEMKLWNGSELHAEYAGFQVGDASTGYRMTYREMLRDRSSVSWDALQLSKGMRFSTMDRDNDVGGFITAATSTLMDFILRKRR